MAADFQTLRGLVKASVPPSVRTWVRSQIGGKTPEPPGVIGGPEVDANPLARRLLDECNSPEVAAIADERLARTRELGLRSDWTDFGSTKEADFARLLVATRKVLPPGSSLETGVFGGETSGLLILSCPASSFHVSVDPYGLPSQSYKPKQGGGDHWAHEYRNWQVARSTGRRLHQLAEECDVTYSHYLASSQKFCKSDLLQHPAPFNLIHLDGDHSYGAVKEELAYFLGKTSPPTVYVMDDHDDHCPGVGRALRERRGELLCLFHRTYDLAGPGVSGFSAWLQTG